MQAYGFSLYSVLLLFSFIYNHMAFTITRLLAIVVAIFLGMVLFSLIGALLGEFVETKKSDNTIMNFLFYIFIFVSDAFYPASTINPAFSRIFAFNPITPMLNIMRGTGQYRQIFIWIAILALLQIIGVKHLRLRR